jgi:cell division protein FtsQ
MKSVAQYIYNHEFWNAQVGQIDITAERKFELIPVIGDHVIKIGSVENIETKLNNLLLFYKQVLSKTGFNKYSVLDVQYEGQVVAANRGATSAVDSIQLKKNIQELLSRKLEEEQNNVAYQTIPVKDSTIKTVEQSTIVTKNTTPIPVEAKPKNPVKSTPAKTTTSKAVEKPKQQAKKPTSKQPKAVMRKG